MNTVTFKKPNGTTKNSYADWGLLLRPKQIVPPAPKIVKMAIEGRDGDIDLTEWAGEVRYNDRAFPLSFYMTCALSEIEAKATEIKNWLHGQRVQITLADDAAYYYAARVSVDDAFADGGIGVLEMAVTAEPYKYKQGKTVATYAVNGNTTVVLQNDRMTTLPKITTDAAFSITKFGKNLVPAFDSSTSEGVTFTADGQGGCTANGTSTGTAYKVFATYKLSPGTYTISGFPSDNPEAYQGYVYAQNAGQSYYAPNGYRTITLETEDTVSVRIRVYNGKTANDVYFRPQLEAGSVATAYAPFAKTTYTVGQAGAHEFADLLLSEGYNAIELNGTGNVQIEYQEGAL